MKNYYNFINEDKLLDFLKKGFAQTMTFLSKERQNSAGILIDSINNKNSFIDGINVVKSTLNSYTSTIKITNMKELKTSLNDDLITIDISLKTLSKKFGMEKLLPKNFYKESNNKILKTCFLYNNEEDFLKNLPFNTNQLLFQILKTSGMEDGEIKKSLETKTETNENKIFELQEVEPLQNTDKLDAQAQSTEDNTTDEENKDEENKDKDNSEEEKDEIDFSKIESSYKNFQANALISPLLKELVVFNNKLEIELKNPKNF